MKEKRNSPCQIKKKKKKNGLQLGKQYIEKKDDLI